MPEHPLATMMKLDPAMTDHLKKTEDLVYADGALPGKYKLLLTMAFDVAHGAANGVRALTGQAMQAGATKEEVAEALRVAYHLTGVGSVYVASQGLKELFP